jgi:hypothetical protein
LSSFYNLEWQAVLLFLDNSEKGGFYGMLSSLSELQEWNLKYRVDYGNLYDEVMRSWWGIPGSIIVGPEYQAINCLA